MLTGDYQFFVINNIDDIKTKRLQAPFNMEAPPSSWAVLCPPEDEGAKVSSLFNFYEITPRFEFPPEFLSQMDHYTVRP